MTLADWVVDILRSRGRTTFYALDKMLLMRGGYNLVKLQETLAELVAAGRIAKIDMTDGTWYDICMLTSV